MSPDVDWPNGMEGGRVHGHADVRAYWQRQWNLIDPRVDPTAFTQDEQGRTSVTVHQVVHDVAGNLLQDRIVHHLYTFHGSLIARMDILEEDSPILTR